jgi:hypothetical protein
MTQADSFYKNSPGESLITNQIHQNKTHKVFLKFLRQNPLRNSFFYSLLSVLLLSQIFFGGSSILAEAQTSNSIGLYIPSISTAQEPERRLPTKGLTPNNWEYEGELKNGDVIRYGWNAGVVLDTENKNRPIRAGGFLKVYVDEVKDENFILDYGSSPLPVEKISGKLKDGTNKIILDYINDTNKSTGNQVSLTFKYRKDGKKPAIRVIDPVEGSPMMTEIDRRFKIEIENFTLEPVKTDDEFRGQLRVYVNEIKEENLVYSHKESTKSEENKYIAQFSSNDFDQTKLKDLEDGDRTLFFVLATGNGKNLEYKAETKLKFNYKGTLEEVKLPKLRIISPSKTSSDLVVNGDTEFKLNIENFELSDSMEQTSDNSGYIQIIIDDMPYKQKFLKDTFTLNEIGYTSSTEGRKTVKVQLVNNQNLKISPESLSSDTIDIIHSPEIKEDGEISVKENNWRIIVVGIIIVLIIGGIIILIFKG